MHSLWRLFLHLSAMPGPGGGNRLCSKALRLLRCTSLEEGVRDQQRHVMNDYPYLWHF